jgi:hypothetical protein
MKCIYEKLRDVAEELGTYTSLQYDEMSEACNMLMVLTGYQDYISDEFKKALLKELERQHKNYDENCEIVEHVETKEHKFMELVWKDEC